MVAEGIGLQKRISLRTGWPTGWSLTHRRARHSGHSSALPSSRRERRAGKEWWSAAEKKPKLDDGALLTPTIGISSVSGT